MSSVSFLLRSQAVICRLNLLQDLPLQERDHAIFNGALFESATLESIFLPPCNFTHPLSCSCGNSYSCQRVRIPHRPMQFIHCMFCRCPTHQQPIVHSHLSIFSHRPHPLATVDVIAPSSVFAAGQTPAPPDTCYRRPADIGEPASARD